MAQENPNKMQAFKMAFIFFAVLVCLSACDSNFQVRSGTASDPFAEEPLGKHEEKYGAYLDVSNKFLSQMKDKNYAALPQYMDEVFLKSSSINELENMHKTMNSAVGAIEGYGKMQWWFRSDKLDNGQKIILLKKLVKHQRETVSYEFAFYEHSNKVIGLNLGIFRWEMPK